MVQVQQANQLTLREVEDKFGLRYVKDPSFFPEWQIETDSLNEYDRKVLDQAQNSFVYLNKDAIQEALVKMIVVSPLLLVAGFYRAPFMTFAEQSTEVEVRDEERAEVIRGKVDILVARGSVWITVVEAKGSKIDTQMGIPQLLAYMLSNSAQAAPLYGMVTNGTNTTFVKLLSDKREYGFSKQYSLYNPGNDLYDVVSVLKAIS